MGAAQSKIARLRAALSHTEGDRVPIGEFFWTGFLKRCRARWGDEFDPYRHFDLDYIVVTPNLDPLIRPFEVLQDDGHDIRLRTGFGATIRRTADFPMPHFEDFDVHVPEAMADVAFDDPADPRRYFTGGDDQLNCVGDALARDLPSWDARLAPYVDDFAVFGSVCEPYEYLWRIIGSEHALLWMAAEPDAFEAFVNRVGEFLLGAARAQIAAGAGRLSGLYIWGDVAYCKGLMFSPATWRRLFKPHVKALLDLCREHGLMTIYHGCGNAETLYNDLIEIGLQGYNPLEAKAGLNVVDLKQRYAGRLAFVGNIDVRVLEQGDPAAIRAEVAGKLAAARGGGWVCQSDHSVSSEVAPESYELLVATLRELGNYPLSV